MHDGYHNFERTPGKSIMEKLDKEVKDNCPTVNNLKDADNMEEEIQDNIKIEENLEEEQRIGSIIGYRKQHSYRR